MPNNLRGVSEMIATLKQISARFPDRVASAIYQEAQIEMTEAKRRCPVWNPERPVPRGHAPGSLRASGFVHEPERHGNNISVTLSFGGAAVDYAIYVHEDLEAFHATGQAKFLESVLNESRSDMASRIASRVDLDRVA